jgi:hypothetical protein
MESDGAAPIRGLAARLAPVAVIAAVIALPLGATWLATSTRNDELVTEAVAGGAPFHPDGWPGAPPLENRRELYDPVKAGETLPDGFRQVIPRDVINPVYNPLFVNGPDIDWPDDELVIGVDIGGEARAYPVGFLNRREIVVDMHRGIPTFVTW